MSATPPIRASTLAASLESAGFDPLDWPATLAEADQVAHVPLMGSFTTALGVTCDGCHLTSRAATTREKRIARHMWDDILGVLQMADGSPLYCDSCHQGQMLFLDRSSPAAITQWMQENMVDKLVRRDGQPHNCATCHGQPPTYDLITVWEQ